MKTPQFIFASCALLGSPIALGCSANNTDDAVVSQTQQALTGVVSADYQFPAVIDEEISSVTETELWGRVYAPATLEDGKRYPLLVFQHGAHGACGDTSTVPRADSLDNYLFDGECYNDRVFVENHAGYGYIAEEMASKGYIVLSVNAVRGVIKGGGNESLIRGRLILKNLEKLAHWDQGTENTPAGFDLDLLGHVDFSEVGLMGHSRGGISAMWAYKLSNEDTIDWSARLGTQLSFRSIFQIAPIDSHAVADPVGIPVATLLPLCDGSVFNQEGVRSFDRSMSLESDTQGVFRATVAVHGTNHNYYNTEWQHSDATSAPDGTCLGQVPLFETLSYRYPAGWYTEGVTGSEQQQEVGKLLMSRFFLGTVGAEKDPAQAALFDPRNELPAEITDITPVDRGFSPSAALSDRIEFDDFQGATGIGPQGEPAFISGVEVEYGELHEHDASYRGAHITWTSSSTQNVFETRLTPAGVGVDIQAFDTLDFRVEPTDNPELNTTDLDFSVQLVDGYGNASARVSVSDYVTLSGRARNHSMLLSTRIPLTDFGNQIPLSSVRGIRFTFDDPAVSSGAIYLASVRATRGGIDAPPATGTGPCSAYCSDPVEFTAGSYHSGNLGSGATCFETIGHLAGGNCGNFSGSRQLLVNGVEMSCDWSGWSLPPAENGGYCIQTTAGGFDWAAFGTW